MSWTFVALFQYLIGLGTLLQMDYDFTKRDPMVGLQGAIVTGTLAGIFGGSTLVFVWEKWLRSRPYGWTLRSIFLSYTLIFTTVAIPTGLFFQSRYLKKSFFDTEVWQESLRVLLSTSTFIPFFFWLMVVIGTFIVFLVNDKYGPGVFKKFLLGKYFNPTREERVFMFLDLKSSTSIAERLGEEKYFNFIKEVYRISTPGILGYHGEIYQYVGDEIVVSWPLDKGVAEANCVQSFFEVKKLLHRKKQYFVDHFGELPVFKAGIHYGHVMAGEIGIVKRDIAFSGDVLNTTARIQGKCNDLGVDLLVSKNLAEKVNSVIPRFHTHTMGMITLKGKQEEMELCSVHLEE